MLRYRLPDHGKKRTGDLMITLKPIDKPGLVRKGDVLLILRRDYTEVNPVMVRKVLHAGTDDEEIIINISCNRYIITSVLMDGKSWVKEAALVVGGRLTAISNNMNEFGTY